MTTVYVEAFDIRFCVTTDGAFVCGNLVTGVTAYAYPSSENAANGLKRPIETARLHVAQARARKRRSPAR